MRLQADDLDILRHKLAESRRLEAALVSFAIISTEPANVLVLQARAKERLEGVTRMEESIKTLEQSNADYLSRLLDAEAEAAAVPKLKESVTTLQQKVNSLEVKQAEATSHATTREAEITRLRAERLEWHAQRTKLEGQLRQAELDVQSTTAALREAERDVHAAAAAAASATVHVDPKM